MFGYSARYELPSSSVSFTVYGETYMDIERDANAKAAKFFPVEERQNRGLGLAFTFDISPSHFELGNEITHWEARVTATFTEPLKS